MFVGHALAAFALVAVASRTLGSRPDRALALGAVAGLFAAAPDVDIGYALVGVAGALGDAGALGLAASFWSTGNVVHRAVTHSLVLAPVAALAAGAWVAGRRRAAGSGASRRRLAVAVALAVGLVAVGTAESGALGGAVTAAFAVVTLALAEAVVRRTGCTPRTTTVLAFVGLASHPFGDVFTGEPPALLYPLDATPPALETRVALSADPTLHLLGAFALELATVWAAALVWVHLRAERDGRPVTRFPRPRVDARAAAGAGYAASVFVIPAPTLELSYPFVFTVLGVGAVGLAPVRVRLRRTVRGDRSLRALIPGVEFARPGLERAGFTGLAAVTLAAGAYLLAYLAGVA